MPRVTEMLESYPMHWNGFDRAKLAECIEACFDPDRLLCKRHQDAPGSVPGRLSGLRQ
jgi:hypothetical protein